VKPKLPTSFTSAARAALVVVAFASSHAWAQQPAPNAANPPPQAGLTIEPEAAKQPPSTKFTNTTQHELAITFGPEKLRLKPGASASVPTPQAQRFQMDVYDKPGKGQFRIRASFMATPNDPKWFLPLTFEKPKKAKQPAPPQ